MGTGKKYHLLALATALVWGTTLVSTKVLLQHGLSPEEIMLYRFVIAYIVLWVMHPKSYPFGGWRDELLFLGTGLFGCTIYFLTENTALAYTQASNVALIVTTAPLVTAFLAHVSVKGERINRNLIVGSSIALPGVALVIFNGNYILKLNPLGDLLSVAAAVSWALYSVLVKQLDRSYPVLYLTRKVFFYSLLTIIPYFWFHPLQRYLWEYSQIEVWTNLFFLGVIASSVCFFVWNTAIKHLGSIRTNNYIYLIPVVTLVTSVWVLHETITGYAIAGMLLILSGLYCVERGLPSALLFFFRKK